MQLTDGSHLDMCHNLVLPAFSRAFFQLEQGADPQLEVECLHITRWKHNNPAEHKTYTQTLDDNELIENMYGDFRMFALLAANEVADIGDINTGSGFEIRALDSAAFSLQFAWLLTTEPDIFDF